MQFINSLYDSNDIHKVTENTWERSRTSACDVCDKELNNSRDFLLYNYYIHVTVYTQTRIPQMGYL